MSRSLKDRLKALEEKQAATKLGTYVWDFGKPPPPEDFEGTLVVVSYIDDHPDDPNIIVREYPDGYVEEIPLDEWRKEEGLTV